MLVNLNVQVKELNVMFVTLVVLVKLFVPIMQMDVMSVRSVVLVNSSNLQLLVNPSFPLLFVMSVTSAVLANSLKQLLLLNLSVSVMQIKSMGLPSNAVTASNICLKDKNEIVFSATKNCFVFKNYFSGPAKNLVSKLALSHNIFTESKVASNYDNSAES